jgi:hypothetical protein
LKTFVEVQALSLQLFAIRPQGKSPTSDTQIISFISDDLMITAVFGKLYVIDPVFSINYGWLGALFLSHYFLAVKRFFL